jgi:hypothetical protein
MMLILFLFVASVLSSEFCFLTKSNEKLCVDHEAFLSAQGTQGFLYKNGLKLAGMNFTLDELSRTMVDFILQNNISDPTCAFYPLNTTDAVPLSIRESTFSTCPKYFVGVNTKNPQCHLDVYNNACIRGDLTVSGTIYGLASGSCWNCTTLNSFLPSRLVQFEYPTDAIINTSSNVDLSFSFRGCGAITRSSTNSLADYGNQRGCNAVDFQLTRTNASQVASGDQTVILNGESHSARRQRSTVINGIGHDVDSVDSLIGGGQRNSVLNTSTSTVLGGTDQIINFQLSIANSAMSVNNNLITAGVRGNNTHAVSSFFSYTQSGSKLVNPSTVLQGYSVAISKNGFYAVVGTNSAGSTVYVKSNVDGSWSQQSYLNGTGQIGTAFQGPTVAIDELGTTIAMGGPGDNGFLGAVWIFVRNNTIWSQQAKLAVNGSVGAPLVGGGGLALSYDGNTLAVGGSNDNSNNGATWIFVRLNGTWTQQGSKLVGTNATGAAFQGCDVSLSADGNTLAVGGYQDNSQKGATWIFVRSLGVWTQQGDKLVATTNNASWQGFSISLSRDGNTLAVGAPNQPPTGAVWIFLRSSGVWNQYNQTLPGAFGVGASQFGYSVALNGDGNILVGGGPSDNANVGAMWLYGFTITGWVRIGSKFLVSDNVGAPAQGFAVDISGRGGTFITGGYTDNSSLGAAWIFDAPYNDTCFVYTTVNDENGFNVIGNGVDNAILITVYCPNTAGFDFIGTGKQLNITNSYFSSALNGLNILVINSLFSNALNGRDGAITNSYFSSIFNSRNTTITNSYYSFAGGLLTSIDQSSGAFLYGEGLTSTTNGNGPSFANHFTGFGRFNSLASQCSFVDAQIFAIGDGTSNASRSNVLTLGANGNMCLKSGSTISVTTVSATTVSATTVSATTVSATTVNTNTVQPATSNTNLNLNALGTGYVNIAKRLPYIYLVATLATQSVGINTPQRISWDTEIEDSYNIVPAAPIAISIPAIWAGLWQITVGAAWTTAVANTDRTLFLNINGTTVAKTAHGTSTAVIAPSEIITTTYPIVGTTTIECWLNQQSGASQSVAAVGQKTTFFQMVRLSA